MAKTKLNEQESDIADLKRQMKEKCELLEDKDLQIDNLIRKQQQELSERASDLEIVQSEVRMYQGQLLSLKKQF